MKVTRALAENAVNTTYEHLPREVVRATKRHILDTLGVMLPPSTLEKGCAALHEFAREAGGKEESTLIGFGGKAPCWMAAFVNGSLCHPMDYDDTIDEFVNHPTAHTFPAAFAIAEKVGNVSGKEFVTAVALGIDLSVRLSASPKGSLVENYPWFPTTIFGIFSATVAAGKILGLTRDETVNALGIALDRASGIRKSIVSPDSDIRAIRDGYNNREGVFAAIMAQKGITAHKDAIETFYEVFFNNSYDTLPLTGNLGKEFWGLKVGLKSWPCCRITHSYVKAGLDLAKEYNIDPSRIEEVLLTVGSFGRDNFFTNLEEKQRPKQSITAKISLPFVLGVALTKKRVIIEDFFPENLGDKNVLEIAKKVKQGKFDPQLCKGAISGAEVAVRMLGGESYSKKVHHPYGHPSSPMSDEELKEKFKDCARYTKKPLSEEKVNHLIEKTLNLEKVRNIDELTQILA